MFERTQPADVDGRPPVGRWGHDPLLEALCREHPDMIPPDYDNKHSEVARLVMERRADALRDLSMK